jgi:hypothetical protein
MDEEGQEQAAIDFNVEDKMKILVDVIILFVLRLRSCLGER